MKSILYNFSNQAGHADVIVETPGFEEFGAWLTGDLQGFGEAFEEVKRAIVDIKSGAKKSEEFDGNGMLLTLTKSGAIVQSLSAFDDDPTIIKADYPPSEEVDLDTFEDMAREWLKYRKNNT